MSETVFLAGASGVIGRCLVPRLIADGWRVVGTTRSVAKGLELSALGAEPAILDVYDAGRLERAVVAAKPSVVLHMLTDLPRGTPPDQLDAARERNARIRDIGTRQLIASAVRAGARRLVAESISFAYAPGPTPYREDAPLNVDADGGAGVTARGVASLERQVLAAPLHGIVLRYGRLYGPGTGVEVAPAHGPLHVEAAAQVAHIAMTIGEVGVYNIAEDDGTVDSGKAARAFGWDGRHC